MTVSSSIGRELDIGKVIQRAYQLAGVYEASQSVRAADESLARDFLEMIVDELSAEGVQARALTTVDVTLTADDYTYSLDDSYLDVVGNGMYIAAGEDTTKAPAETLVEQIDQQRWHTISAKNATTRPSLFWANRVATGIEIRYWPIPNEAGTVRHTVQRQLSDCKDTTKTLDLQTYWHDYLLWQLAAYLAEAKSISGNKVNRLMQVARARLGRAKGMANEHVDNYAYVSHSGGRYG